MNWGVKIVLGMAAFMSFIIGMAVYMFNHYGNDALVEDDYYEKGINYNVEFDAKENTIIDGATPIIKISKSQLIIQLKDSASYQLLLMRPSAKALDIASKGETVGDANLILINTSNLKKGVWQLKLSWLSNKKNYLFTKDIML